MFSHFSCLSSVCVSLLLLTPLPQISLHRNLISRRSPIPLPTPPFESVLGQVNTSSPLHLSIWKPCLSVRLSVCWLSEAAGDLKLSSRGCWRGWGFRPSPLAWLELRDGVLGGRKGGSSVGDDSLSIHRSTIRPISSGWIKSCTELINRPLSVITSAPARIPPLERLSAFPNGFFIHPLSSLSVF